MVQINPLYLAGLCWKSNTPLTFKKGKRFFKINMWLYVSCCRGNKGGKQYKLFVVYSLSVLRVMPTNMLV